MLDCPKCGIAAYDGNSCSACRFSVGSKAKTVIDPMHLICQHVFEGQRCAEAGALSEGQRGAGPWYCRKHFPLFAGRDYVKRPTPPPQGFASMKSVLKGRQPGEDQAEGST
jgi:hypothetical protein